MTKRNKKLRRLYYFIVLLIVGGIIHSCITINGSGFSGLSEAEKQKIKSCPDSIGSVKNDGNLYKVTAKQVNIYIKDKKDVLVYEYLPFCKGEGGRSPVEVKQICDEKKWNCIVISSVYDGIFPIPPSNTFPMFVIDNSVYNTDNYQKYCNSFYADLTNNNNKERKICSFHYFHNGKYVRSYGSIHDVDN